MQIWCIKMDYALGNSKGWVGVNGKIVTYPSLDEARAEARKISLKPGVPGVAVGKVSWMVINYRGDKGIKSISQVGTVIKGNWKEKGKSTEKPIKPNGKV